MSQLGTDTASAIVDTDTLALIAQADVIVRNCSGPNCNVTTSTRQAITQQLSELSQQQARGTLTILAVPTSSVLGRQITEAYINLGAAVSSVYNFQCGTTTVNSTTCVTNAAAVQSAQNTLESLLVQPAANEANHVVVLSILAVVGIVAFLLFFIFLLIGLVEAHENREYAAGVASVTSPIPITIHSTSQPPRIPVQPIPVTSSNSVPFTTESNIPLPASPFIE